MIISILSKAILKFNGDNFIKKMTDPLEYLEIYGKSLKVSVILGLP